MGNSKKLPYEVLYESDVRGSYLILKMNQEEGIYNYQVEMMMNNEIPSLLGFSLRQKDIHKYLYYNITSKLQLKNLLERRKLKKGALLDILIEILQGIFAGGNYLLRHEGYIIDEEYIFLHPENLQVSLLYVPCPMENRNLREELLQLVNRLMISIDPNEESNNQFLLKIIYELNMETFNLEDFLNCLRDLKGNEWKIKSEVNNRGQKEIQWKEESQPTPPLVIEETATTMEETKLGYTSKTKLMILLWEIIIFSMVALIFLETNLLINPTTGELDGVSMMGVLMLAGVVNVLLFKKIFTKEEIILEKKVHQVKSNNSVKAVNPIKSVKPVNPIKTANPIKAVSSKKSTGSVETTNPVKFVESVKKSTSSLKIDKREINNIPKELPIIPNDHVPIDSLDTVILDINEERPQLVSLQGGMTETISLHQDLFLIGKLEEQVDYVIPRKTVSRIHAEIRFSNGEYLLKDLNSRNGTYLNGQRIHSNIEYSLKSNDKIAFADAEYVFSSQENIS